MQSNMMQSNDDFNVDPCHFSFLLFCGTGVLWSQGSIRMGCDKTSKFTRYKNGKKIFTAMISICCRFKGVVFNCFSYVIFVNLSKPTSLTCYKD